MGSKNEKIKLKKNRKFHGFNSQMADNKFGKKRRYLNFLQEKKGKKEAKYKKRRTQYYYYKRRTPKRFDIFDHK